MKLRHESQISGMHISSLPSDCWLNKKIHLFWRGWFHLCERGRTAAVLESGFALHLSGYKIMALGNHLTFVASCVKREREQGS